MIVVIIVIVAGAAYIEFRDNGNNGENSISRSGATTYPTGNLSGAIQVYDLKGVSGINQVYFNVPDGTMCLVFLMYTNNSVASVCVYNSTGGFQASLANNVATIHFEGQRNTYHNPITGSSTSKWEISFDVHLETGGNFNFKIYAANYILG